MQQPRIIVIGAYTECGAYGLNNGMPWPKGGIPGDLVRFKQITTQGKGNVLICGKITAKTLEELKLGERCLISVSRSAKQGEHGNRRYSSSNFENAHQLALSLEPEKVFYIGGENTWLHGIGIANEILLTIAERTCKGRVSRLKQPLHVIAQDSGFSCLKREVLENNSPDAWVRRYRFEQWVRQK